jgi:hypothetical protein
MKEIIMLAEKFTTIFRAEHRRVRDLLLEMMKAARSGDRVGFRARLGQLAALTGPHFRYEEESLYPELTAFFTEEYVEKLYGDHDMAIRSALRLADLAGQGQLSDADAQSAVRTLQSILPHVTDCDGLSILIETLPEDKLRSILETRDRANERGLDLIAWAEQERDRPLPVAS